VGIWIKCHFSNYTLWREQHCIIGWLLNLKRIRRWKSSICGRLIDNLSFSLITWRSVISVRSSYHINHLKHVHLRGACGSIPMVEMTYVPPLHAGKILLLNQLRGTLQKSRNFLMMRVVFCVVIFLTNHTRKLRLPNQLSINRLRIIMLVIIFLGFTLIFLLTS
jgi:hypothetical protein